MMRKKYHMDTRALLSQDILTRCFPTCVWDFRQIAQPDHARVRARRSRSKASDLMRKKHTVGTRALPSQEILTRGSFQTRLGPPKDRSVQQCSRALARCDRIRASGIMRKNYHMGTRANSRAKHHGILARPTKPETYKRTLAHVANIVPQELLN